MAEEEGEKVIRSSIKTIWDLIKKEKMWSAIPMSLFMTVVIVMVFNIEPYEKEILNAKAFKNTIAGALLFVSIYTMLVIEEVVDKYKTTIRDHDRTIKELERLLLKRSSYYE